MMNLYEEVAKCFTNAKFMIATMHVIKTCNLDSFDRWVVFLYGQYGIDLLIRASGDFRMSYLSNFILLMLNSLYMLHGGDEYKDSVTLLRARNNGVQWELMKPEYVYVISLRTNYYHQSNH